MNTPMKKRCTACTMEREASEFIRKNKTYKTCNKCSEYHKRRNNNQNVFNVNVPTPIILQNLYDMKKLSPALEQKYKHIKSLESMLIHEASIELGLKQ